MLEGYGDGATHRAIYDPIMRKAYALCTHDFTPLHGRDGAPITLDPRPPDAEQACPECAKLTVQ